MSAISLSSFPVLSVITWSPFVGALLIMFLARRSALLVRWLAVVATAVPLVLSIAIYATYDREAAGFQFYEEMPLVPPLGITYQLGVDGVSLLLVLLTSIIIFAGVFASWTVKERSQEFYALLLLLVTGFLVRAVARPVRNVASGATQIAAGDLSTRIPQGGPAEIRELTTAFNSMAESVQHGRRELEIQNEQLRQSERAKSELITIVSHELRTPLASILGYTSLILRRGTDEGTLRRYVEIIHDQGQRLAGIAEGFLEADETDDAEDEQVAAGQVG